MCKKVTCDRCGKATCEGCGEHVEEALAGVAQADRCTCRDATPQQNSGGGVAGVSSW